MNTRAPDTSQEAAAWHCLTPAQAARRLEVDPAAGLDDAQATARLAAHGANALPEAPRRGLARMVVDQFTDFMILVLLAAAVISGFIGEAADTLAIVIIVLLNAAIGVAQEYRAEKSMDALRRMAAPTARVRRGGAALAITADRVVPGDVVVLEAGNIVPADLRLIDAAGLQIAEAALTGESVPVTKFSHALDVADTPLGDRCNMAYRGTVVVAGRGTGLAAETGAHTELGKIAALLTTREDPRTPLQKRLARLGATLAMAVVAISVVILIAGLLRGEPLVLMVLTALSLAVAAIPEALPAVVAIGLAFGAMKMANSNALVRRLPAVETLGSITYICTDKTGTLTENRMRTEVLCADGLSIAPEHARGRGEPWATLLRVLVLNNDAVVGAQGRAEGEPTEAALLEAALRAGVTQAETQAAWPRIGEAPFDAQRKRMTTLHRAQQGVVAYVKGAPETVLSRCRWQRGAQGDVPLDERAWSSTAEDMAAQGLRVLALACRTLERVPEEAAAAESDLVLLGLAGLIDPPRAQAARAVAECKSAGIVPVMITGDHPATARALARRLDIVDEKGGVLTGGALAALGDEELARRVCEVRVYARVDPAQKIRIVEALQARGEAVAMTGDGVNDAPALMRADIGVAMGRIGTDVAREAAHMVLLDDNFATIVAAVREGRRIFDNIRKFVRYALTGNSAEIVTIFLAPFIGLPIPLLPIHILWINLVTDGLPGLALASEPAERDVMARPPRPPGESLFARGMWQRILWMGLLIAGVSLLAQALGLHGGLGHWQSMVFTVLCLSQLALVLSIRIERERAFGAGSGGNRFLMATVALTALLQIALLYVPAFNAVFKTQPLAWHELLLCVALSAVVFVAAEAEKYLVRRGWLYVDAIRPGKLTA